MRLVLSFLICLLFSYQAYAAAQVSPVVAFPPMTKYVEVKAGQIWWTRLPVDQGDELRTSIYVHNDVYDDVDAFICSEADLMRFKAGDTSRCQGVNRGKRQFQFQYLVRSPENHYLVLNNSFSMIVKKKVNYTIEIAKHLDEQKRQTIENQLMGFSQQIQKNFNVQEFDIHLKPCGQQNAYSMNATGNIVICTELFFDLILKEMPGALAGIIFHELGHSLLNLWGLPNYGNEETVDEFAIVMLYWAGRQEMAFDMMKYFAAKNSQQEAQYKLSYDSKHPLSIQRVRNIERILRNPRDIIMRWNKLLYPQMTKAGLRELLETSPMYADKELAQHYLNQ